MSFLAVLGQFITSYVIGALFAPKPKFDVPKAGNIEAPTSSRGTPVPLIYGKVKLSPNVVFFGGARYTAIKENVKTSDGFFGIGASYSSVTKGYKYYCSLQGALCMGPVDKIYQISFDDKQAYQKSDGIGPIWNGGQTDLYLNSPALFGGDEREGGVVGNVSVYYGNINSYISGQDPFLVKFTGQYTPSIGHIAYILLKDVYFGTSPYLKNLSVVIGRTTSLVWQLEGCLNTEDIDINGDCNPVAIIADLILNPKYGLGLPSELIDKDNFTAVATTLKNEGFGLSYSITQQTQAKSIIEDVLRHIDGILYTDITTGKFCLKLARQDYNPDTLLILDESNISNLDFSRMSWEETKNEVKIKFTDRNNNFVENVAQAQDLANLAIREGETDSETIDMAGISNATNASISAIRSLRALSYPLAKVQITANRKAYNLKPGDVFKLNWSEYGISNSIYRVTGINYGLLETGTVEIDAVEDVFGVGNAVIVTPPPTGYNENTIPENITNAKILEVPAFFDYERRVAVLPVKPNATTMEYSLYKENELVTTQGNFAECGSLDISISEQSEEIILNNINGLDTLPNVYDDDFYAGRTLFIMGEEFIAFKSIQEIGGKYKLTNIYRGLLDTVPQQHIAGEKAYFLCGSGAIVNNVPLTQDGIVTAKITGRTFNGESDIEQATELSITTNSRASRPLPPADVKINDVNYPSEITGDAVITWKYRQVSNKIVPQTADNDIKPYNIQFIVKIYVDNILKRTIEKGLEDMENTHTYTIQDRLLDNPDLTKQVKVEIIAKDISNNLENIQKVSMVFIMK